MQALLRPTLRLPSTARLFSTSATPLMPLQPAKSRKTTPFRKPLRPRALDPLVADPDARHLRVTDSGDDGMTLIVRQGQSIRAAGEAEMSDAGRVLLEGSYAGPSSVPASPTPEAASAASPTPTAHEPYLPPLVRPSRHRPEADGPPRVLSLSEIADLRTLRKSSNQSVQKLADRFGVPVPSIKALLYANLAEKKAAAAETVRKMVRARGHESIERKLAREERRIRRSMW